MGQGKQAKVLSERQIRAALDHVSRTKYADRNRVMALLSAKAGLRAKEIAGLTWAMVTNAEGALAGVIQLTDASSKGKGGGRTIPIHKDLRIALETLRAVHPDSSPRRPVVFSEKGSGLSAESVAVWFHRLYSGLGFDGCSSHSGRRTFITRAARKIVEAGGSLRDVQQLAGHSSLQTTQRYIGENPDAKRRVVDMI